VAQIKWQTSPILAPLPPPNPDVQKLLIAGTVRYKVVTLHHNCSHSTIKATCVVHEKNNFKNNVEEFEEGRAKPPVTA